MTYIIVLIIFEVFSIAQEIVRYETKQITYLDLHVVVEEDVPELQISVDDAVDVKVMDALQQLCHIVAGLGLGHRLSTLVELQQGLEILHFKKKRKKEHGWKRVWQITQLCTAAPAV